MRYKTKFNNHDIMLSSHALDRFKDRERFNSLANSSKFIDTLLNVIEDGIDVIINKYKNKEATYGIHSKSTGIGCIIDWRKDTKYRTDKDNHAFVVTLLPIKKFHSFNNRELPIIVEGLLSYWFDDRNKRRFFEGATDTASEGTFHVVMFEGYFWDSSFDYRNNFIFVD